MTIRAYDGALNVVRRMPRSRRVNLYAFRMAARSLNSQPVVRESYRGWTLYVRWYNSFALAAEGWICYPIAPGSTAAQSVRLGRYSNREQAMEQGRDWVDQAGQRPDSKRTRKTA